MNVILLKDIRKIGRKDEVKTVSDGYALNFLIPQGLAKQATPDELRGLNERKRVVDQTRAKRMETAKALVASLKNAQVVIRAKTEGGKLFTAIHEDDVKRALAEQHPEPAAGTYAVVFDAPIKKPGEYRVLLDFGEGITAPIALSVLPQE
ncbi:MAG: 50S ribosomal protein L9 [Candidatus Liptonbacteria bacterium]|nr:50S ribosomal protein L9 [Candidatus Liptonbacteria bacterium]